MANPFILYVCPLLGNLLAVFMLLSPTPAVLAIRRSKQLGTTNPLPYPFTAANCFGWIVYGLLLRNGWVVAANVAGLIAGLFFTLSVLPYAERKSQDVLTGLILGFAMYFAILGMIGSFQLTSEAHTKLWGIQSVVVLLAYYAIPLSTMVQVIRTRDAASIYMPLACASIANGSLWGVYGFFGIHDFNVWMPNSVGALLGVLQLALRLKFGDPTSSGAGAKTSGLPTVVSHDQIRTLPSYATSSQPDLHKSSLNSVDSERGLLPVNGSGTHLHLLANHNHHNSHHNNHSDGPFYSHHNQSQLSPLYEGNTPTPHKTGVSAAGLQATPTAAAAPAAVVHTGTGGVDVHVSGPTGTKRSGIQ